MLKLKQRIAGFILILAVLKLLFSGSMVKTVLSDSSCIMMFYADTIRPSMGGFFIDCFSACKGGIMENKRIAVAAIVIDEQSAAVEVNNVLHDYSDIIIGRMGIPYKERGISLISVALDADPDVISSLTGRLGQIQGVSVKAAISKK